MPGHIALGNVGALRDYMILDTNLYSKAPANQFAAKLATGAGDYDDLQNWSYWVMDDWQSGVGKKDAEGGGFLYGETETRYPEQMLLSRHLHLEMADNYTDASSVSGETTVGTTATKQKWARILFGDAGRSLDTVWVYLKNDGETFTVRLSADGESGPGTSLASTTITTDATTPGYAWYKATLTDTAITDSIYWISLEHASSASVPKVGTDHGGVSFKYYDGAVWQSTGDAFGVFFNTEAYGAVPLDNAQVVEFNNELYVIGYNNPTIYKRDDAAATGWTAAAGSVTGTQLLSLGDLLYIALDESTGIPSYMDTSETITNFFVPDDANGEVAHLANYGGFLWAGYGPNVFYTSTPGADGSPDWTGPIVIGLAGEKVTGLAGQGDYMYVATEKELVYVGFADEVLGVSVWGSPSPHNGKGMLHYQGQLFIPVQESLIRFDGTSILPVGIDLGEGLPGDRQGNVAALTSTNNWLLMGVNPRNANTVGGGVWAFNGQGWHHIATLPPGISISSLYYRRSNQRLYIGCDTGHVFSLYLTDVAQVVDTTEPEFAPVGWVETDWFFGGLKEIEKDFESVYVSGEDCTANQYVDVYWRDDESTEWEYLGRVDDNRVELRWSDYSTRPKSRQLKLGLLMRTTAANASPLIRAIRIKYHPMVSDWFRWSFPILVSDNQQELGGGKSTYNAYQKRTHLDGLITQVPPFIFRDMDDIEYEVKVMGAQIQHEGVELINGVKVFDSVYNITIEAIRNGIYT